MLDRTIHHARQVVNVESWLSVNGVEKTIGHREPVARKHKTPAPAPVRVQGRSRVAGGYWSAASSRSRSGDKLSERQALSRRHTTLLMSLAAVRSVLCLECCSYSFLVYEL